MATRETIQLVRRLLAPIARRVRLTVSRAVLDLINDTEGMQLVQVDLLSDELRSDVEHFQPYGFTSVPSQGAEGVYLSVGGDRSHGVVVCLADRANRKTGLQDGEVAVYHRDGAYALLDEDGHINLVTKTGSKTKLATGEGLGAFLSELHSAISGWTPVANDGGAALQTALTAWLALTPPGDS